MWWKILVPAGFAAAAAYLLYGLFAFRRYCRANSIRIISSIQSRINPGHGYSVIGHYVVERGGREFEAVFLHRSFRPSKIKHYEVDVPTEAANGSSEEAPA